MKVYSEKILSKHNSANKSESHKICISSEFFSKLLITPSSKANNLYKHRKNFSQTIIRQLIWNNT